MKSCSVNECQKTSTRLGYCTAHYRRFKRHGDPRGGRISWGSSAYEAILDRGWSRMGECLSWNGSTNVYGYGVLKRGGKVSSCHRTVFEMWNHPIPKGLHIDHTCHNEAALRNECAGGVTCPHRRCINPSHLRAVTPGENIRASLSHRRAVSKLRYERGECIMFGCQHMIIGRRKLCGKHEQRERHHGSPCVTKMRGGPGRMQLEVWDLMCSPDAARR
jgi:hypothetical protein